MSDLSHQEAAGHHYPAKSGWRSLCAEVKKSLEADTESGNQDAAPVMNRGYLYGPFS